jgi:hypothetical protein
MAEFIIRAAASWKSSGWIIHCRNPEFKGHRKDTWEEAYDEFKTFVSGFVRTLIPSGSPEIDFQDPIIRGKSERFTTEGNTFVIRCGQDEVKLSWIVVITHNPNRSLDEFNEGVKVMLEEASPEDVAA